MGTVLVTGSEGLVGTALRRQLAARGYDVRALDLRASDPAARGDVRDVERVRSAMDGCDGVVHLAAVSRVVSAERQPQLCEQTNVDALRQLLRMALERARRPWVVFASSREVYGQAAQLPVVEDAPLVPMNVYGCSKVAGERLCADATAAGLSTATVRLSNVYGSVHDHPDRVVPAFVRAALAGEPLRLDGAESTFDFTYVDDAAEGLARVVAALSSAERLPVIHLTTGAATSLGQLADLVLRTCASASRTEIAPPRHFDVSRFVGDPSRAASLLGWWAVTPLAAGVASLVAAFSAKRQEAHR